MSSQAHDAVAEWVPVVGWLGDVEAHVSEAPTLGSVDADQVTEAADAVRAARLAISALLGEYVTEASSTVFDTDGPGEQQPAPGDAQHDAARDRGPIAATRPGGQPAPTGRPARADQPAQTGRWPS